MRETLSKGWTRLRGWMGTHPLANESARQSTTPLVLLARPGGSYRRRVAWRSIRPQAVRPGLNHRGRGGQHGRHPRGERLVNGPDDLVKREVDRQRVALPRVTGSGTPAPSAPSALAAHEAAARVEQRPHKDTKSREAASGPVGVKTRLQTRTCMCRRSVTAPTVLVQRHSSASGVTTGLAVADPVEPTVAVALGVAPEVSGGGVQAAELSGDPPPAMRPI